MLKSLEVSFVCCSIDMIRLFSEDAVVFLSVLRWYKDWMVKSKFCLFINIIRLHRSTTYVHRESKKGLQISDF